MFIFDRGKQRMPSPADALPGRTSPIPTAERHFVNGLPLAPDPVGEGDRQARLAVGAKDPLCAGEPLVGAHRLGRRALGAGSATPVVK